MIGRTISHYEIVEKIGEGGMGVVYKARDTRLDRTVAIKVLPPDRISSHHARERFEREARVVSSLNHPNVCTLHDVGRQDGTDYLVMEYVEGRPLKGPMPLENALRLAVQITDALDHAHRHGVIHRDLKPANILVTKSGAKLLDFGLAKLTPARDSEADPTRTAGLTKEGTIVGTYHYMAPEQLEGKEADARSDIFSFGAVVYEMVTGRTAFEGKSQASLIAAIMHKDPPPLSSVESMSPPALDHIVKRCLEKDPDRRWQSAADLREELQWTAEPATETGVPVPPGLVRRLRFHRRVNIALAAVLVLTVGISVALWLSRPAAIPEAPLRRFAFTPDSLGPSRFERAVISPNGRYVVYVSGGAQEKLWIHDLMRDEPLEIDATDGARRPFWSPDSKLIGFAAGQDLKKISVQGGPAITLCRLPSSSYLGGTLSPDGASIVFSSGSPLRLYEIPARGGTPKLLIEPGESEQHKDFLLPHFLPIEARGRSLLFTLGTGGQYDLVVQNLETGQREVLATGFAHAYSPSGHILYEPTPDRSGILLALPFSIETLKPTGEAFPIAQNAADASVASDGTLAYVDSGMGEQQQLVWRDRSGKKLGVIGQPQPSLRRPALSPDGRQVAVDGFENGNWDIWVHDIDRGTKTRLTFDPAVDSRATWSPSGKDVTFTSNRDGNADLFSKPADGTGKPARLVGTPARELSPDWSPDGKYLVYRKADPKTIRDIWYLERKEGGGYESVPFLQTPAREQVAKFSPDGRFVAYSSNESGQYHIYVRPFPEGGGRWQVSVKRGTQPRWRKDGKELFYVEGTMLVAAAVTTLRFSVGSAVRLFQDRSLASSGATPRYDVSSDGQRFVMVETLGTEEDKPPAIHVVQNWFAEFRDRQE
jgi:serine/threonine protein kinase